ncbi:MAG: SAM-dependent methyltransferase, partial [Lentisphaerae bacterium]|nr:SAM-dependent methyltransferase [Lentisphaerota bacterium]
PDVLGYIFEKYINQKQMGAYYTKEDITEYIAKNCIIPFILDRVETALKGNPESFSNLFQPLASEPDRYIYDPVKHGVTLPLPPEIEEGVDTGKPNLLERRAVWNQPAPAEYALPTEIWREVVARHQRHAELCSRLTANPLPITTNDLITLNLDIRQFAQDCIENAATPDVLWGFWRAIEEITVLDPTCGSGAFLFAAVNILEPLYEACLDRMKAFMLEWSQASKVPHPKYYKDFAEVIARVEKHPNEKYFIFKSIIIHNLYGVDIMDEAVEICKLRLFLKLAAQIEPDYNQHNLGIEPLPDIDFNIRAGNTLVGFATEKQAEDVIQQDLLGYKTVWPEVKREAQEISELFNLFRRQQTEIGGAVSAADKKRLRDKLAPLEARLHNYLASTYGINDQNGIKKWIQSHNPFHWFIEFYEIMDKGGFNVIIGNPPYVELSDLKGQYSIRNFRLLATGNLYALCIERFSMFIRVAGRCGVIVPISFVSTPRMFPLMQFATNTFSPLYLSHFAVRPGKLFLGVDMNLTILLGQATLANHEQEIWSTRYNRWQEKSRCVLFETLTYAKTALCADLK